MGISVVEHATWWLTGPGLLGDAHAQASAEAAIERLRGGAWHGERDQRDARPPAHLTGAGCHGCSSPAAGSQEPGAGSKRTPIPGSVTK